MKPAAATITKSLIDRLNDMDPSADEFKFLLAGVKRDAAKLADADLSAQQCVLGMVACMDKVIPSMHRHHNISIQHAGGLLSYSQALFNYAVSLSRCGFHHDSYGYFKRSYEADRTDLRIIQFACFAAIRSGYFREALEYFCDDLFDYCEDVDRANLLAHEKFCLQPSYDFDDRCFVEMTRQAYDTLNRLAPCNWDLTYEFCPRENGSFHLCLMIKVDNAVDLDQLENEVFDKLESLEGYETMKEFVPMFFVNDSLINLIEAVDKDIENGNIIKPSIEFIKEMDELLDGVVLD